MKYRNSIYCDETSQLTLPRWSCQACQVRDAHIDILQPEVSDSSEDFKIHGPDPTDGEIAVNVTEERFSLVKSEICLNNDTQGEIFYKKQVTIFSQK